MMDKGYNFSAARRMIDQWVQTQKAAGISLQIVRKGETLLATQVGFADLETKKRLNADSIYRIYSMTKPVTVVLLMTLYEKGLVHLNDPVSTYLPGFKNLQVFDRQADQWVIRPATRDMTLHHLLTMTSGLPYPDQDHPSARALAEQTAALFDQAGTGPALDLVGMANQLGQLPLCFDPGASWRYGLSIDVIGAIVEVVSGQKLSHYLKQTLLDPLGMKDTGFFVPPDKLPRLATLYAGDKGLHPHQDRTLTPGHTQPTQAPAIEFGGAGLYSTRADYLRFARLLLAGGTLDGVRILSPRSVQLIQKDHLTPGQRQAFHRHGWQGYSYGLGVRVLLDEARAGSLAHPGEYGWEGAAGTWFRIDPQEGLITLYLTQHLPGHHLLRIPPLQATIYAAL